MILTIFNQYKVQMKGKMERGKNIDNYIYVCLVNCEACSLKHTQVNSFIHKLLHAGKICQDEQE